MNRVEALLRREIGLDAASIGPTMVERAARLRMKALGLKHLDYYIRLLESSPAEQDELVEAVVVTETWFFRDRDSFTVFTQLAQEWFRENPVGTLRILSVPCSTGEEPYSAAMCLLEARIPQERFVIDAVDVSARSLSHATRAIYGKNSFRGKNLLFRDRHFQRHKNTFALNKSVRDCVRFHRDNLLKGSFLSGREPYNFIFCRNVLIYFDPATQTRALEMLGGKVARNGFLFAGPAEMPIFLSNGFISANFPMAFACRKAEDAQRPPRAAKGPKVSQPPPFLQPIQRTPAPNRQPQPTSGPAGEMERAEKLADQGNLKEATEICESHIRNNGPSARVFYLLGLVLDAGGDARAADYYRKALYLEPDHYESLWHMSLLLEKNGDVQGARAFKRRAEKAQKKA